MTNSSGYTDFAEKNDELAEAVHSGWPVFGHQADRTGWTLSGRMGTFPTIKDAVLPANDPFTLMCVPGVWLVMGEPRKARKSPGHKVRYPRCYLVIP